MENKVTQKMELELEELKKFRSEASYDRTKEILSREIVKVEAEIALMRTKIASNGNAEQPKVKRINIQLHEHAFDQSDKYVKIFIPFNAAKISDDNVQTEFTEKTFNVLIQTDNKDYRFIVNNLLKSIDVAKSYKKVKTDMVSIYLKKAKEGDKWDCLTVTEKRLKDQKSKTFEEDKEAGSSDPMGGLMSMMKKMYDSGDSEMKRTIAKAWTEGQENKANQAPMF